MSAEPDQSAPTSTPAAEVEVDESLLRRLLETQHPDLADRAIEALEPGWDNFMFRVGDDLVARLPRRQTAAALIATEQRWLRQLAPVLPLAVPAVLRTGEPSLGYPWNWSLLPWLAGEPADVETLASDQATVLAGFLCALHRPAPAAAPANPVRGVPLAQRDGVVAPRLRRLAERGHITPSLSAVWERGLDAPVDQQPCWIHGDLQPRNVLAAGGRLTAIIDWGDIGAGDRATDLAAVWMLIDDPADRRQAIAACGSLQPGAWRRAAAWAVSFGTVLLETGLADHPRHARIGATILQRLAAGPTPATLD